MKNKKTILAIGAAFMFLSANAQENWNLEQCIKYAIENNITIKQEIANQNQREIELNTAKWSRLPNLNGYLSQQTTFGRSEQMDNTRANRNVNNANVGFSTNVPLFTGLQIPNNIALSKLNLKAAMEDLSKTKDDISIAIATSYIQVLFDQEILKVAQNQVTMSEEILKQKTAFFNNGKASESEVYNAKSQLEQDKLSVVQADNDCKLALLDLSQLLELKSPDKFSIVTPETNDMFSEISMPESVYQDAILIKPEIKAANYRLEGADKSIKIAQSSFYPQLSFQAGIGNSYYHVNGSEYNESFSSQWHQNLSKYFGFNLNIPVFNRFSVRNKVRSARVDKTILGWKYEEAKKDLYKEIQKAYYNAVAAKSKYESSTTANEASEVSLKLMKEKYTLGKANITEFNQQRTDWLKTVSNMLQAKYDYLFRTKILDFYKGEKLTLE